MTFQLLTSKEEPKVIKPILVVCDRCQQVIKNVRFVRVHKNSAFYRFSKNDESILCEPCLMKDGGYLEEYGKVS
jgi:hypothetical protein